LSIDSQNYRSRRREALTQLAKRTADRALKRGRTVTLNPMSRAIGASFTSRCAMNRR